MSDISLIFGPVDIALLALIIGTPGLALGALIGALLWRSRRPRGGIVGAAIGFILWLPGFILWKMSPWADANKRRAAACLGEPRREVCGRIGERA